jgi:hypothetical protein
MMLLESRRKAGRRLWVGTSRQEKNSCHQRKEAAIDISLLPEEKRTEARL